MLVQVQGTLLLIRPPGYRILLCVTKLASDITVELGSDLIVQTAGWVQHDRKIVPLVDHAAPPDSALNPTLAKGHQLYQPPLICFMILSVTMSKLFISLN